MCNQVSVNTLYEQCLYRENATSQEVKSAEWQHTEHYQFVYICLYEYIETGDIISKLGTRYGDEGEYWTKDLINENRSEAIRRAIHRMDVLSEALYKHAEQAKAKAEA